MTTAEFLEKFEAYLNDVLSDKNLCSPLAQAMRYSIEGGGKRTRPTAVFLAADAFCNDKNFPLADVLKLAAAIELIHTYSLVHDDLPSMDNDDFRRGKPSAHKQFGEANALLTGDRLLTYAMQLLVEGSINNENFNIAASKLASSAADMADGQYYDLRGMKTKDDYMMMYSQKTAALFVGAFTAGAVVGGADAHAQAAVSEYAAHLGLAFQIADDLLDLDDENSIISVVGEAEARKMLMEETEKAIFAVRALKKPTALLDFAQMLLNRKK